jgi:hypothetical protein
LHLPLSISPALFVASNLFGDLPEAYNVADFNALTDPVSIGFVVPAIMDLRDIRRLQPKNRFAVMEAQI